MPSRKRAKGASLSVEALQGLFEQGEEIFDTVEDVRELLIAVAACLTCKTCGGAGRKALKVEDAPDGTSARVVGVSEVCECRKAVQEALDEITAEDVCDDGSEEDLEDEDDEDEG